MCLYSSARWTRVQAIEAQLQQLAGIDRAIGEKIEEHFQSTIQQSQKQLGAQANSGVQSDIGPEANKRRKRVSRLEQEVQERYGPVKAQLQRSDCMAGNSQGKEGHQSPGRRT